MKSFRTSVLTFLAFTATALAALAADPNGTWKFKTTTPNGRTAESTLTLVWQNQQLTGTIDNRAGKAEIREGRFASDQVSFTVDREMGRRLRKKTFTLRYSGKLEGDAITGTIETTGREGKPVSLPWKAERVQ